MTAMRMYGLSPECVCVCTLSHGEATAECTQVLETEKIKHTTVMSKTKPRGGEARVAPKYTDKARHHQFRS